MHIKQIIKSFIVFAVIFLGGYQVIQWVYYSNQGYAFNSFVQITPDSIAVHSSQDSNTIKILCLGGSTTHNFDLDRENQYPAILKTLLEDSLKDINIEVVNGGSDWYTTKHSLINYTTYYNRFKPDYVFVMHAVNDICRSFTPKDLAIGGYKADYTHYFGPGYNIANPPMLEKHIAKIILGEERFENLTTDLKAKELEMDEYVSIQAFTENYSNLVKYIQADGGKCYIIEQPSLYQENMEDSLSHYFWFGRFLCNNYGGVYPSNSSLYLAMKLFNQEAEKLAYSNEVDFIKTTDILYPDLLFFNDDVHYTPLGKETLAKIVFQHLIADITAHQHKP